MEFKINKKQAGERIDKFLSLQIPNLSRNQIQKLIGKSTVNGRTIKKNYILNPDDTILVNIPDKPAPDIKPVKRKLKIIYENNNMAIIDKPPNLPVHQDTNRNHDITLINLLIGNNINLSSMGGEDRPGIVHRLDMNTSGLMAIAKNDYAYAFLRKQFENRSVVKKYICLTAGNLTSKRGKIDSPIGRDLSNRKKMSIVTGQSGKKAITEFKVKETLNHDNISIPLSLVEINLLTGRTHQIRVHLAAIDCPVAGDEVYGKKKINEEVKSLGLKRQFLHASELQLKPDEHENTKKFISKLPTDLSDFLSILKR